MCTQCSSHGAGSAPDGDEGKRCRRSGGHGSCSCPDSCGGRSTSRLPSAAAFPLFLASLLHSRDSAILQKRFRLDPVPVFKEELDVAVDQDLAVVRQCDPKAFKGAGGRSFKINPAAAETAPVTRTLEFVLGLKPSGCAPQVRTDGRQSVKPLRITDDPDPVVILVLLAHLTDDVVLRETGLERRGRFIQNTRKHHPQCADRGSRKKHEKSGPSRQGEEISTADTPYAEVMFGGFVLLRFLDRSRGNGRFRLRRRDGRRRC